MNEATHAKVAAIKQSFRLRMNGDVSRSMREKGVTYKLNWGISVIELRDMAKDYEKDFSLAMALWKEPIRECKILATMLMPKEDMLPDRVDIWMEQTPTLEVAEQAVLNLYQYIDNAQSLAYKWMASQQEMEQTCGFLLLTRLLMHGNTLNEREIDEMIDQAVTSIMSGNSQLQRAAITCLRRFGEQKDDQEKIVEKALRPLNLELF